MRTGIGIGIRTGAAVEAEPAADAEYDETTELSAVAEATGAGVWDGAEHVWHGSNRHLGRMLGSLTVLAAVLTLALIFVMQNAQNVQIAYFQGRLRLPLGVAVLLGIVLGIMLVVIPGAARMAQLRISGRRRRAG
jgi:uncharacterized integral membrane protein